jgi:hypothetical protein
MDTLTFIVAYGLIAAYILFGAGFAVGLAHTNWRVRYFTALAWPFVLGGFIGEAFRNQEHDYD